MRGKYNLSNRRVYLIGGETAFKIGLSTNPMKRFYEVQRAANGRFGSLRLLFDAAGDWHDERKAQWALADWRIEGEWFDKKVLSSGIALIHRLPDVFDYDKDIRASLDRMPELPRV